MAAVGDLPDVREAGPSGSPQPVAPVDSEAGLPDRRPESGSGLRTFDTARTGKWITRPSS